MNKKNKDLVIFSTINTFNGAMAQAIAKGEKTNEIINDFKTLMDAIEAIPEINEQIII